MRLEILEDHEFELNHAHVSAAVLERWGLPESFVALALCHHPQTVQMQLSTHDEQIALRVMRIGRSRGKHAHQSQEANPILNCIKYCAKTVSLDRKNLAPASPRRFRK